MTRITWGEVGARYYENGVDRGVLYVSGQAGVPWNGLTSIVENVNGGAPKPFYVDKEKYLNTATREEYSATLTAYTYPDEFEMCDGSVQLRAGFVATGQRRQPFSLSYRTMLGNDVTPTIGYKVHIVYNALASPTVKTYKSISSTQDPDDFSWSLTALPPSNLGFVRTSHFILDSRFMDPQILAAIEDILYGNAEISATLPDVPTLLDLIDNGATLTVTLLGGGLFSLEAPLSDLQMLDDSIFQVTWDTVVDNGDGTFTASSP